MAYSITVVVPLAEFETGLTLKTQLYDDAGLAFGSPITTGFTEIGGGFYQWTYDAVPNGFQGAGYFIDDATEEIKAGFAVNPGETEGVVEGTDTFPVTYRLTTSLATPIDGLAVQLWDNGLTAPIRASQITDSNGEVHFAVQAGNYKMVINTGQLYESVPPQVLVVDGPEN